MIGAGLGCVVRRAGTIRRVLAERLVRVEREVAVDLARRDVVEAADPDLTRCIAECLRAEHVGADETSGVEDRQAVVRLGGEVNDRVESVAREDLLDERLVADVAVDEGDRTALFQRGDGRLVAGIGECVQHDDDIARVALGPETHEVRADETGSAGD